MLGRSLAVAWIAVCLVCGCASTKCTPSRPRSVAPRCPAVGAAGSQGPTTGTAALASRTGTARAIHSEPAPTGPRAANARTPIAVVPSRPNADRSRWPSGVGHTFDGEESPKVKELERGARAARDEGLVLHAGGAGRVG